MRGEVPLLAMEHVARAFPAPAGRVDVLREVSFELLSHRGMTLIWMTSTSVRFASDSCHERSGARAARNSRVPVDVRSFQATSNVLRQLNRPGSLKKRCAPPEVRLL